MFTTPGYLFTPNRFPSSSLSFSVGTGAGVGTGGVVCVYSGCIYPITRTPWKASSLRSNGLEDQIATISGITIHHKRDSTTPPLTPRTRNGDSISVVTWLMTLDENPDPQGDVSEQYVVSTVFWSTSWESTTLHQSRFTWVFGRRGVWTLLALPRLNINHTNV